jgi:energy-coupling factor transport system substrate-specific component
VFLAGQIGLDDEMRRTIHLAGLLHDVGKIGIPDTVLRKPNKLTADEYDMFKQHVALGDAIVRDVPQVETVRAGIRHHHERWDGNGYPSGLQGHDIPIEARIVGIADAFVAMREARPYRVAKSTRDAVAELHRGAGTQFDPHLVDPLVESVVADERPPLRLVSRLH